MDPNDNLREQLQIAAVILKTWGECNADGSLTDGQRNYLADQAGRLAELVLALDDWIRKGGFIPQKWVIWTPESGEEGADERPH